MPYPAAARGSVPPIVGRYWLDDEFTTAVIAPLPTPRTCEPGPGTLTLVQNDGQFSISSGQLQIPAQTTPTVGDLGFYGGLLSRLAGGAMLLSYQRASVGASDNQPQIGWKATLGLPSNGFAALAFIFDSSGGGRGTNAVTNVLILPTSTISANTPYLVSLVQRAAGGLIFIRGGTFAAQTLIWLTNDDVSAQLMPFFNNYNVVGTMDYIHEANLPAPFTTDYGIASVHATPGVAGTDYTATADGIFDLVITTPNSLSLTSGLKYRKDVSNNYWQYWIDGSGNLKLQRFAAGVGQGSATTLSSGITVNQTVTLRVICYGASMDFFTQIGSTWLRRVSADVTDSFLASNTLLNPFADAGWTLGQLDGYPRTSSNYNVLDTA